ncbi:ABC transporter ATP-binding protein [Bordetella bronchiseptica]|uniref:ABC transporter ATP-binding protein n=1 Tax=Bordetella bronchiseptica TaxID=518 RepID=UPI000460C168|nr:ABC transporter ATP-binding protein [Bordetella bronchiseptica]AZW14981.1 ABC transporter ATP-binding protein [Bordetella bronchiseptica]KDC48643.1 ABC transporter, ATP-binding protein [Bordetella bronchiseptica M85/00/2]KDC64154.1 ABC transporter, ATP-binding protein [Bordetella bronchiseptica MBORD624]KDD60641.1 ABC transporter, ATP-binding protein [Bordetella bronchiseptica SO10328]KDD84190.1 ABC transporter, ATP-binding protein [Bordetella bronchiseptica MBORD678]
MSHLVLDDLTKQYGEAAAISGVSFTAPAGSFTVLLGPSGCGKSTTLRMIAGLDTPTSGRIRIGDRDVTDLPPAKRRISMVFQSYALFPHLSVRENILFGLKVRKEPARDYERRLARVAGLLGLQALLDRKPAQLSGGQQQRVALGRAVISEAPVCLMDEPLSNLDAQLRHDMRREIRALQQELGITMVYVTHDQTEAMSMADQVVLMRGGRIEQLDTPDGLYARPATEFAARFIGTPPMNLIALDTHDGRPVVAGTQGPALANAPAGAATLGLRPEHIRIDADGMPAVIESVEYFGADSVAVCRLGSCGGVAVRVNGHLRSAPGTTVCLAWPDERQHFFAADAAVL